MKLKIDKKTKVKTKFIKSTKKKIKHINQLELTFEKDKKIKKNDKDLNFNYNNSINSISRIFLSSFLIISFFYVVPLFISFAKKNIYTKEFKNNSKKILAYTLNKQNENKENTKSQSEEEL